MTWIVGIICIVLVVIFWRIFLPLALVAVIAIGGVVIHENNQSNMRDRDRVRAEQSLRDKLEKVSNNGANVDRKWVVSTVRDPASGEDVPRLASVLADNGMCTLQVEHRIDGMDLTGIYCQGFKIDSFDNIEVKFDTRPTSDKMRLQKFSDGDGVYIPSDQYTYSSQLQYDEFLRRMTSAKKIALQVKFDAVGRHWIAFSLKGADAALLSIGAVKVKWDAPSQDQNNLNKGFSAPREQLPANDGSGAMHSRTTSDNARLTDSSGKAGTENTPSLPTNAELDYTGNNWKCKRGFRNVKNECHALILPEHAEVDYTGSDWKCQRGFRYVRNACEAVKIPEHAELDYTGSDWKCQRGFRYVRNACEAVKIPEHAELDYTGSDWKCQRGFRYVRNACEAVKIPEHAELDYTGSDWKCQRGFRLEGAQCVPVGVISSN